ncbi:MAG: amidase [Chloroflexi bacterium]|nr:amidase [Chloroflexota bacterium]
MTEPYELSATAAAKMFRTKQLSPRELVKSLLERIAAVDPAIHAWQAVESDQNEIFPYFDNNYFNHNPRGIRAFPLSHLAGIPVGVKDVIGVSGMPTAAAFAPYADRRVGDAEVVAGIRVRRAILLGKTVTTQFAYADPAPTVNPWRTDRTPGGSSAGSAAAVAARMAPLALGTQTAGSILRPAAYCGVIGFKPTYGRFSTRGVIPLAWSLDHIGFICREVDDLALVLNCDDFIPRNNPTLGLVTDVVDAAEPEVREHTIAQAKRLASWGARVVEFRLGDLAEVLAIHQVVMQTEVAAVHAQNLERYAEHYAPRLRAYVEVGKLIPGYVYQHVQRLRSQYRHALLETFKGLGLDALLTPTASNVAPGRETTGDPSFQAIWTLIGLPAISLPSGISAEGLPFAMQLAGLPGQDERLLEVAKWCENVLGRMPPPPEPFGVPPANSLPG